MKKFKTTAITEDGIKYLSFKDPGCLIDVDNRDLLTRYDDSCPVSEEVAKGIGITIRGETYISTNAMIMHTEDCPSHQIMLRLRETLLDVYKKDMKRAAA